MLNFLDCRTSWRQHWSCSSLRERSCIVRQRESLRQGLARAIGWLWRAARWDCARHDLEDEARVWQGRRGLALSARRVAAWSGLAGRGRQGWACRSRLDLSEARQARHGRTWQGSTGSGRARQARSRLGATCRGGVEAGQARPGATRRCEGRRGRFDRSCREGEARQAGRDEARASWAGEAWSGAVRQA